MYDRGDLVRCFLAAQNKGFGGYYPDSGSFNSALEAYYQSMLEGLGQLFGLRLSTQRPASMEHAAFWMLFRSTADSFLGIRTPWSRFLEAGLIHQKIDAAGAAGERVAAASTRISDLADQSRQAHLDMLDALIQIMLAERSDLTFTTDDLAQVGVADQRPDPSDYTLYED